MPSKDSKVANLKTFWFDKASDKNCTTTNKEAPVIERAPLSMIIETTVIEDVKKDPISIAFIHVLHDGIKTKSQRPGP
jgi:hypothetical protein